MGSMLSHFRPWLDAWVQSAYGEGGFWRVSQPAEHFRTASESTEVLASVIAGLLEEHPQIWGVLELGAGRGKLLSDLAALRPDLELAGVDIRARPPGLVDKVSWAQDLWDVTSAVWRTGQLAGLLLALDHPILVICAEWLDDLPCVIAARTDAGLRSIEVDPGGTERLGGALDAPSLAWAERWWPVGPRLEIGSTRDDAWATVLSGLRPHGGLALAIDYGHRTRERPDRGTLAAYRRGQSVRPEPSVTLNLTVAVAVDSLAASGCRVGASTLMMRRQHEVLGAGYRDVPGTDALTDLSRRGQWAALRDPSIWGDQWWLLQEIPPGLPPT